MRINWYNRMLLSYAPIFFVVISSLIFVFFTTLNSSSQNKYIETNEAIFQQMVQYTDANLQLIERNVVREIYKNKTLQSFFDDTPKTVYEYYFIQEKLNEFASSFPFLNSMYLYSETTQQILTGSGKFPLEAFADASFFLEAYEEPGLKGWSTPREYRESVLDQNKKVISLIKYYPYAFGKEGAVVINVDVKSIMAFLNNLDNNGHNVIQILDENKQPFQTIIEPISTKPIYATSKYTGWSFYFDSVYADEFSILSLLSNIWIILGIFIIVLAIVWFTIITHINYKPIQTIMGKIDDYTARKSDELGIKSPRNELKFIESAIDHFLKKTVDYDTLHKEDMLLRKRNLFNELLIGHKTITESEWERQMASFGLSHSYERLGVVVFEIDHYAQFTERYSSSDQYLLKYIIQTAFQELTQEKELLIWHTWIQPQQMSVVFHFHSNHEPYQDTLQQICEEYRKWINTNLELTLSAGIGRETGSIGQIAESYRNASENVSYKAVFGTNSLIDNRLKGTKANGEKFNWFQTLLEMAHFYRLDDEQWVGKFNHIFTEIQQMLLSKADIENFVNNLAHQLQKEINTLSPEIQALWRDEYQEQFFKIANRTETMNEMNEQVLTVMIKLAKEIEHERISRKNHSIAVQVKAYIDRNYADSNLSLNQVSDLFGVSPKSISNLFKEELGEKFFDYLVKVRFDHATQLLQETDEPIQFIAEKVGYVHVISFHRAFKKMFDLPPGEYRNLHRFHHE
ncbi:AraC family transcriptional regulator [Paenibacillus alkaliterrae]|uniref:helix-turn-helix domain-containing protein n=1 Tax=Paenibacillus alkaliterrae TaxID=320909 RepID=UPI001F199F4D|nr:helix-turn-helix domain-containing protein [Paenibacillus alkaliterrae]MCF2940050.1 AraC family transcriptional regulator [Paenibacillus alkaliterrae]